MKIIDLLNKMANGEDVPMKIKYGNEILYYDSDDNENNCYNATLNYYDIRGNNELFNGCIGQFLNDEVEIIEEDKKIEKITLDDWAEITYSEDWKLLTYDFNRNSNLFVDKINEIIEKLNEEKE